MNEYINTWVQKGDYWYYYDENGYPITAGWKYLPVANDSNEAAYFYFDLEGKRCENIFIRDSYGWCYLNENGEWINTGGTVNYKDHDYTLTPEGHLPEIPYKNEKTSPNDGWAKEGDEGEWYCYENGNKITERWVYDTQYWYYLGQDGKISKNTIINGQYFVNSSGQYVYSSKASYGTDILYCNNKGIVVKNHWETDYYGRKYYFNNNGAMLKNGWYFIEGNYYYFDNSGVMFKNTCKNDSYGMTYIDENGKWVKGISILTYKGYSFEVNENGYVQSRLDSSGKYLDGWNCDKKGLFYREGGADKKGWIKIGEDWYYGGSDGYIITNSWEQIGEYWYYFQQDGLMMKSRYWPDSSGKEVFLTSGGSMKTNGWVQTREKVFMYADSSGYRVEGWKSIVDNENVAQWYYFIPNKSPINTGKMAVGWQYISGERYYFDENDNSQIMGRMITGWKSLLHYEKGVYIDENSSEVSGYYYFGNDGKMIYGKWHSITQAVKWNLATEETSGYQDYDHVYYLFATNGRMRTGWYQEDDRWYYLATGADSKKIDENTSSLKSSSSTKYLGGCVYGWFNPALDGGPAGENYTNYYYFTEGTGQVFKNGWKKDSYGLCWLDDKGTLAKDTIISVNNKKYYITIKSILETNAGFYDINVESGTETIYVKDTTGELLSNGWNEIGDYWYVFYNTAYMAKNKIFSDTKGLCLIDEKGRWYKPKSENGEIVQNNDNYYFISGDGYIKVDAWVRLANSDDHRKWAWAEKDGHFSTASKWIFYDNGWYYITYDENNNKVEGYPQIAVTVNFEQTIGGNKYLFNGYVDQDLNGVIQKAAQLWAGRWLYYPIEGGGNANPTNWHYADVTGRLLANRWMLWEKAGISNEKDKWVYLDSDHRAAKNKWAKDSVDWCYVGNDGFMVYNQWVERDKSWSYVGDKGHILRNTIQNDSEGPKYIGENGLLRHNEWTKDEKGWRYLRNGAIVTPPNGRSYLWIEDLGNWYCLDKDGVMMSNQWQEDSTGWCYLGADGKMYKNKWVEGNLSIANEGEGLKYWYYIDNKGHVLQFNVDKKVYFINGYYYLFKSFSQNNKRYSHLVSNEFYEVPISSEQAKEKGENGGNIYYFTYSGDTAILGKGCPFRWETTNTGFRAYYPDNSKPYIEGWAKDIKGLRYVKNGYAVKGWHNIENKQYYFDDAGHMVTNKWVQGSDGWCYLNSKGNPVVDSTRIIGGKEYTFDKEGYWIG